MTAALSVAPQSYITYNTTANSWNTSATNAATSIYWVPTGTTQYTIVAGDDGTYSWGNQPGVESVQLDKDGKLIIPKGKSLLLPDGTVVEVDDMGNLRIDDANAKVIYQACRMREFNPFVNASDLLASFIKYVGGLGLVREEIGKLPVALFVNWLVIEAARADGDAVPDGVTPPERHPLLLQRARPRCLYRRCRRFVGRAIAASGFSFCHPAHAAAHFGELTMAPMPKLLPAVT